MALSVPDSDSGSWGLLQPVSDSGSQKYDAMLSELLPGGDANKDGMVDYADFQILEADYGMTGAWWEQGDFNDDGVVNWADLNILRTNLDPAAMTLGQFAQIAIFGQPDTIPSGQSPEYDGYGVTYVSDMPWVSSTNGQGAVQINASARLADCAGRYALRAGAGGRRRFASTVNLGGTYSQFQSDIGVDSPGGRRGRLRRLWRRQFALPIADLTASSGAVPIDLNVAGVQQLTLVVNAANSNTAGDHAVWADARLVSTANFTQAPGLAVYFDLAGLATRQSLVD